MADKHFAGIVLVALLTVVYAQLAYGHWVGSGDGEELDPSFLPMDDEDSPHSSRRNGRGNAKPTRSSRTQAPNRDSSDKPASGDDRSDNQKDSRSEEQSSEASDSSHLRIPGGTGNAEKESDGSGSRSGSGSELAKETPPLHDDADSPCKRTRGTCQDVSTPCNGEYRPGYCGGPRRRQCCVQKEYGDLPCENIGGACQYTSERCSGEYLTGKCGGPRSRKCCVQKMYQDLPCENVDGACQYISEPCSGEYLTGKCGGPRSRKCCVTGGRDSGGGEETNKLPTNDGDTSNNSTRDESQSHNNTSRENSGNATESENEDETPPVDVNGPETATFGAEDLPCENIGGTCQDVSEPCDGDYISRKCDGPSTRMCCVQKKTPEMKDNSGYKYGDIAKVPTTGASSETSKGLSYKGVAASRYMARADMKKMDLYKKLIVQVGNELGMDPAIIAGIISRESRAGALLAKDGTGDQGNAVGLMQIDKRHHKDIKGGPYSVENIRRGTKILITMINGVSKKFADWSKEMKLKGGIAAYNRGVGGVKGLDVIDKKTHHKDYSNDVVARAQYFRENGY